MASSIDTEFPVDNIKVDKADWRTQQIIIKREIEALQDSTRVARLMAFGVVSFNLANN